RTARGSEVAVLAALRVGCVREQPRVEHLRGEAEPLAAFCLQPAKVLSREEPLRVTGTDRVDVAGGLDGGAGDQRGRYQVIERDLEVEVEVQLLAHLALPGLDVPQHQSAGRTLQTIDPALQPDRPPPANRHRQRPRLPQDHLDAHEFSVNPVAPSGTDQNTASTI